jgi:hypothetical protein
MLRRVALVLKLVLLLIGLAGGAASTAAWLVSRPSSSSAQALTGRDGFEGRLNELKSRFNEALAEGEQAGAETERRLRQELAALRTNPDRPLVT